jgi:hypothetical protein
VAVEASGQILVVDAAAGTGGLGALFRVDSVTGTRTLLSDFGAGAQGPLGIDPVGVAVEASGQILVADETGGTGLLGALFRVDPTTGARTLLSDFGAGAQGPLGVNPTGVTVEASGQILVVDPSTGTGGGGALFRIAPGGPAVPPPSRLTLAACTLNLQQDWVPVWTKLQFDVWNEDEIKFTGAYECSDSWHETAFTAGTQAVAGLAAGINAVDDGIDAAAQNFARTTVGTDLARFRVQGVRSTQCENATIKTQAIGLVAVHATLFGNTRWVGTTLTGAGKFSGTIRWDPAGAAPEGGIR